MKTLYETILDIEGTIASSDKALPVVMADLHDILRNTCPGWMDKGYPLENAFVCFNGNELYTTEVDCSEISEFRKCVNQFIKVVSKKYKTKVTRNNQGGASIHVEFTDYPNTIDKRNMDAKYLSMWFNCGKYGLPFIEGPKEILG